MPSERQKPEPFPPTMSPGDPAFCCAILRDQRGFYVLERRPLHEIDAPGLLTCFGGTREPHELPEACLRREMLEELGFTLGDISLSVVLITPRLTSKGTVRVARQAWFYRALGPSPGEARALEEGYEAVWLDPRDVEHAPIADWNRLAIMADMRGERMARVE
jgi:8-oxo-dGTP pyrophosphatase MutT (NUDIX family)